MTKEDYSFLNNSPIGLEESKMNIFQSLFRANTRPKNALGGGSFFFGGSNAGERVNEHTALQLFTAVG